MMHVTEPIAPCRHRRQTAPMAFTLVESLVVIAIICVLISLMSPALFGAREQAHLTRWKSYSQALRSDPDVVAYYTLDNIAPGQTLTLENAAIGDPMDPSSAPERYSVSAPPTLPTTDGRWEGKTAILFDPALNGDAIELPMRELLDASAMSVVSWIRVDGAPAGGFAYLINQWWWDQSDDRSWSLNLSGDYLELRISSDGTGGSNYSSSLMASARGGNGHGNGGSNTGTGNNGNGVGNTGPGNQGNDSDNGNAGGNNGCNENNGNGGSNTGTGNNGNGVGNTGPGNQGNDGTNGNAGGNNGSNGNNGNGGSNTGTGNNGNGNGNTGPGNQGNDSGNGNAGGGGSNNGNGSGGSNGGSSNDSTIILRGLINDFYSQWIQVAATWDGNTASLYINGQLVDSANVSRIHRSPRPVMIGAGNSGSAYPFKGTVDEVAILKRALTGEEIQQSYAMGQP